MKIHEEVLAAARRLGAARGDWSFTPVDIVRALPHRNENSVRTHIVSRCCVNAPSHHAHRWPYFKRLDRGRYVVERPYRQSPYAGSHTGRENFVVADADSAHGVAPSSVRSTIHAAIFEEGGRYTAECLELAVVTQGHSLDETLRNLRDGIDLYMSDEDPAVLGLPPRPKLVLSFETSALPG